MNLIEAFQISKKLNKHIRRECWPDYLHYAFCQCDAHDGITWWIHVYISELCRYCKISFSSEDFFADDWEAV